MYINLCFKETTKHLIIVIMSFALFINSMLQRLQFSFPRLPLLFYAASWTTVLTVTVAVASFTPELAFVSAITPASAFSAACRGGGSSVRIPLDVPSEVFCFPAQLFRKSKMDLVVPPIFAAVVVAASAYVVKAMALWESADQEERR